MTTFRDTHSPQRSEHTRSRFSIDCAGAQLEVHTRRQATVLRFGGEIDASNAGLVGQTICRFARLNAPLIIDISRLNFLGIAGFRTLVAFNEQIQVTGPSCQVVPGAALRRLTRFVTNHGLPLTDSVSEAVACADDAARTCRSSRQSEPQRNTLP
jgi:anti-anti-sigma factor